jgi:potassium voltage-gated channel Eag-related subfamily H protein 8
MEISSRQMQLDAQLKRAARYLIKPAGHFRTCWDITLVTLVVYNAFALPFVVCFRITQPSSVEIIDRIIDAFFYLDLVLNFFTTYEVKGHLVLDNKTVAYHYLTHWFIVDLVGAFPFEVFAGESIGEAHTLEVTLLRGVKCIRLIRLARLFKFLEKIEFVSHFLKLLRLFFGFSIIAHWLACLWYLIGDAGLDFGGTDAPAGWMVSQRL